MGKRGRKPKQIRIEIGKSEGELRYATLMDALTAALPDIAEALANYESACTTTTKRDTVCNPKTTLNDPSNDYEHDLNA